MLGAGACAFLDTIDFNLTIEKGEKVAIVGPTGCGKTTMINLLLRYYDPVSGTIYIDDINTFGTV